jgi:hypothetical protein
MRAALERAESARIISPFAMVVQTIVPVLCFPGIVMATSKSVRPADGAALKINNNQKI